MKIGFVVPYPPGEAASQRFRFEQYFDLLKSKGVEIVFFSFLNEKGWKGLYSKSNTLSKAGFTLLGFCRRVLHLFSLIRCDQVFIHREASPLGPPLFEWIIAKVLRKRIVYDFDDAIWLADTSPTNKKLSWFKFPSKSLKIARWAQVVSVGNDYLARKIRDFNASVVVNPTTIDMDYHQPIEMFESVEILTLGWTGSHSTLKYLEDILPVLDQLKELKFRLLVIADIAPSTRFPWMEFVPWNKGTEIEVLNKIDVGIMPLRDDAWARGKCGFKLLQYMALEKPCIASPVGVNNKIITESKSGYLCSDLTQWGEAISQLNAIYQRREMGIRGREYIRTNYSLESNSRTVLRLFELE